jgi:hypothetical protein
MTNCRLSISNITQLVIATACLLAAGCTTVTTTSFKVVDSPNVEASFIATDANFAKYDRLTTDDMGIYFPAGKGPTTEDQAKLRQIFRDAFLGELEGYVISEEPGPKTMMIQATLIDFRNTTSADSLSVRRELRDIARPGALLFLMEMKDSESGRVLARAADSASAPKISYSEESTTDWTAVEAAAARWAGLFRQFLDENLDQ